MSFENLKNKKVKFNIKAEIVRWILLLLVGAWLLHPYATDRLIGSGDALWYRNMLADYISQIRAGVFPVYVGQTDFAFNGAVYPLRVAPLYQHAAGILDMMTGHKLEYGTLQNHVVITVGLVGLFISYFTLKDLVPQHRWAAAAMAILYISCPGLLGTIYSQDLYMTWMTVPFAPLVAYGLARSFQRADLGAQVWLGIGLAGAWLAHAPVALWLTLAAIVVQLCRLLFVHRTKEAWLQAAFGSALTLTLGHYPFVSVALLKPFLSNGNLVHTSLSEPSQILASLKTAFPQSFLPLNNYAVQLGDLQLGYSLAFTTSAAFIFGIAKRKAVLICLGSVAICLLLVLLPLPCFSEWFWLKALSNEFQALTNYWPMHRLYIVIATLVAAAGVMLLQEINLNSRSQKLLAASAITLACVWNLSEARKLVSTAVTRTASNQESELKMRAENRLLMNHSYGLFTSIPAYFSNGTVHPSSEIRLLSTKTLDPIKFEPIHKDPLRAFNGQLDSNPGILNLEPKFKLEPGSRHRLEIAFQSSRSYSGTLQIVGPGFFREYTLPSSGRPAAFGSGPVSANTIDLWTTSNSAIWIQLRFIPNNGLAPQLFIPFALYRFTTLTDIDSHTSLHSIWPWRATINAPTNSVVESFRMYIDGYTVKIDGRPVNITASPRGLVSFEISAGIHTAELNYNAPFPVKISYWATIVLWLVTLTWALTRKSFNLRLKHAGLQKI